jgi:hypothetical protein
MPERSLLFRLSPKQIITMIAIAMGAAMAIAIMQNLFILTHLAIEQWRKPILFWDSWEYASQTNELSWLLQQHNEHRIVWAKLATLIETNILARPPTSTALFQILGLNIINILILFGICKNTFRKNSTQILTWLCCSLVLLNPWQAENLIWEFQTPWFFTNTLILLLTFTVNLYIKSGQKKHGTPLLIAAAILPWVSLFNTGQGLALIASLCLACAFISARLAIVSALSSFLSIIYYFKILTYAKPQHHPRIVFDPDYFSTIILGGPWQGMALLLTALIIIQFTLSGKKSTFNSPSKSSKPIFLTLAIPGIFAIFFAVMTTLSRSGFGVHQALSERYVTHSLMLVLSMILITTSAWEAKANFAFNSSTASKTELLIPSLTIAATLLSIPQILTKQSPLYSAALQSITNQSEERRSSMENLSLVESLKRSGIAAEGQFTTKLSPDLSIPRKYFSGQLETKPLGWHKAISNSKINLNSASGDTFLYSKDKILIGPQNLSLQGWAFVKSQPRKRILIIAKYSNGSFLAYSSNTARPDVQAAYPMAKANTGFDLSIPLKKGSQRLQEIMIGSEDGSKSIWTNP